MCSWFVPILSDLFQLIFTWERGSGSEMIVPGCNTVLYVLHKTDEKITCEYLILFTWTNTWTLMFISFSWWGFVASSVSNSGQGVVL